MMLRFILFALFCAGGVFAQTEGIYMPYRKGDLWGYSDANGKIIIAPAYDKVGEKDIEGQFRIYKGNKIGIADKSGAVILPPQFDSIFPRYYNPRGHMLFVQKDGLWGVFTHEGKQMIPIKYDELDKPHFLADGTPEGKVFIAKKDNEYLLVSNEDKVLESGLQAAEEMSKDGIRLKRGNKFALFDIRAQKTVTAFEFDSIAMIDTGWNHRNREDKIFYGAIGPRHYSISINGEKHELKSQPGLTGQLGVSVSEEINLHFPHKEYVVLPEQAVPDAYSSVKNNKGYKYRQAIIKGWNYGYVIKSEKKGLIGLEGRRGEYFIPPVYKKIVVFEYGGPAVLYDGKKAGLYNYETNTMMIPPAYDAIHNRGLYVLEKKGKVGVFDENGRGLPVGTQDTFLIEPAYDKYLERIEKTDMSYSSFYVYKFMNNGKICYVGMNGVKFFDDGN